MSKDPAFPTIAIWGVGLIGGSLGMAWRRAGIAREVIGVDRPEVLKEAVRLGAIDRPGAPHEAARQADVILLAAPVRSIIDLAQTLAPYVRPGTVVTDAGSTKEAIVKAWEEHLPAGAAFVGAHPMFGREVAGVANASPDLPRGGRYIITPGPRSTPEAVETVRRLAEAAGGVVRTMTAAQHDAAVALVSHVPQMVATALAAGALEADEQQADVLDLAASGFRDTTRIAGSPADIWTDIFLTNREAVLQALLRFRESLDALEGAVEWSDPEAIARIFARAHEARMRLPK